MNTIFSYNANANYSTKDLKGGYNNISFSLLDIYLDEKGPSLKIQLSNIFKDCHIVAKPKPILHNLVIPLPHKQGFTKVKNTYIKIAYYSTCDDYDVDADETWMYGIGFIRLVMVFLVMR